jgi:hypothetical protein
MKKGDKVQVRNIDADASKPESWFDCEVHGFGKDNIVHARVTHPGHQLDGKILVVDGDHIRAAEAKA